MYDCERSNGGCSGRDVEKVVNEIHQVAAMTTPAPPSGAWDHNSMDV